MSVKHIATRRLPMWDNREYIATTVFSLHLRRCNSRETLLDGRPNMAKTQGSGNLSLQQRSSCCASVGAFCVAVRKDGPGTKQPPARAFKQSRAAPAPSASAAPLGRFHSTENLPQSQRISPPLTASSTCTVPFNPCRLVRPFMLCGCVHNWHCVGGAQQRCHNFFPTLPAITL